MKAALTLERRVTLWSAVVVAVSLLVCGGGGAWFLYRQEVAQLDRQLRGVADQFFEQKRLHGGATFDLRNAHEIAEWLPAPGLGIVAEIEHQGNVFYRSPRLGAHALPARAGSFRFVSHDLGRLRVGVLAENGTTLRLGAPADHVVALVRNMVLVLALGAPVMIVLVIAGGRTIARRALAPVQAMTAAAETIRAEDLTRRVPVPAPPDELRRLALVLNATLDRLEASFLQAQRFTADASHELKTPLTLLQVELDALRGSAELREEQRAAVVTALESVQRLKAITANLLLLASADAGRLQLAEQRVDFTSLLRDCLEDGRIVAAAAGISVAIGNLPAAQVQGDPVRLGQIVGNLFDNAVKYNVRGGRIDVRLEVAGGTCVLEIGNTGPGIPPEHRPDVFERFYRAAHQGPIPGHGLGLSIARELARAHHGSLELVRADERETVFRLVLPIVPADAGAVAGGGASEPR